MVNPSARTSNFSMARWLLVVLFWTIVILVYETEGSSVSLHPVVLGGKRNDRPDACLVRGGGDTDLLLSSLEEQYPSIHEFLTTEDREGALEKFHIHGWRWHTASLVREARRLCTLAQRARAAATCGPSLDAITQALSQAADYVVGFNMKGLHRIEADLMFPWMRNKLTNKDLSIPQDTIQGFATAMTQLETDRETLVLLGRSIVRLKELIHGP